MYNGAARDRGDKKRQRLAPPPNEVWMEAIMSKGKTPDGYIPVSAVAIASSSTTWQGDAQYGQEQYSTASQGRIIECSTGYATQAGMNTAYPGRTDSRTETLQGRTSKFQASTEAFQGRIIQSRPPGYQQPSADASTILKGKLAEDYKRERKLPPRVEEMLREQVNLDERILHAAYAVAMEDLIPEKEANFVAKGLCHLCGENGIHYAPVVNFCPHANERHSLCREHLRSVYRVRMEALFVGRNGSAPNRRLLRCLVCASGCPCSACKLFKEQEVQKYKRYLLDTLRRNGHGGTAVLKDDRAVAATSTGANGTMMVSSAPMVMNSDVRRYTPYPPTQPGDGRTLVQKNGIATPNVENGRSWEKHIQTPAQLAEYARQSAALPSSRASYFPDMQAQQKILPRYPPMPKRAAKDTPADMLSVIADSAQATDPRIAARVASPHVHQGSSESPTAATLLNCAESEKSLVHLLSTLNQNTTPSSSMAMDSSVSSRSKADSSLPQSISRFMTNGIVSKNGGSGRAQNSGHQGPSGQMEASPKVQTGRGIAIKHRQADSTHSYQSSTSSMDSAGGSTPRARSNSGALSAKALARKRAASGRDTGNSSAAPHDSNKNSQFGRRDDEEKRRYSSEARLKLNTSKVENKSAANTGKGSRSTESLPGYGGARHLEKERRSAESSLAYGSGDPRQQKKGNSSNVSLNPRAERKSSHDRKTAPPVKRGRGRPPKIAKPVKQDEEETEDEAYSERVEGGEEELEEGEENDSDSELDANLDFCEVCQGAGDLVCCDKCPRSFHLKCLHMKESDLPEGDWQCAECRKPSRFDSYSKAVASELGLLDKCLKIVECLKSHPFSKPFLKPVEKVPMYTRVVKQPRDLTTIGEKLKKGAYIVDSNTVAAGVKELDSTHFANDIRLMWSNCKLFNDDGSGITRAADILSAGFERLYKESIAPPLTT